MNKVLEQQLQNRFPTYFRDLYGDRQKTCMSWGLTCGEGWFDLIYKMCERIEESLPPPTFKFEQIKEKFGLLRVYSSGGTNLTQKIIDEIENMSAQVCEQCGTEGDHVTTEGSYIQTLCPNCRLTRSHYGITEKIN